MATNEKTPKDAPKPAQPPSAVGAIAGFAIVGVALIVGIVPIFRACDSGGSATPVSDVCGLKDTLEDRLSCYQNQLLSARARNAPTIETETSIDILKKQIAAHDEQRAEAEYRKVYDKLQARCKEIREKKVVDLTVEDRERFGECGISIK